MTRHRMALILSTAGIAGVLGLAGCGAAKDGASAAANGAAAAGNQVVGEIADEAVALRQVGFETGLMTSGTEATAASPAASDQAASDPSGSASSGSASAAAPAASASAGADKKNKRRKAMRRFLAANVMHGEVTVQGKDGVRTIVVQRGAVTAVTATGVTVKSADGFTETWTFGSGLRVVQARKAVQASAIKAGETIGLAGTKSGDADVAGLVAIK